MDDRGGPAFQMNLREARAKIERKMILQALKRWGGCVSYAAADLGISRPAMYDLMRKLKIKRDVRFHL